MRINMMMIVTITERWRRTGKMKCVITTWKEHGGGDAFWKPTSTGVASDEHGQKRLPWVKKPAICVRLHLLVLGWHLLWTEACQNTLRPPTSLHPLSSLLPLSFFSKFKSHDDHFFHHIQKLNEKMWKRPGSIKKLDFFFFKHVYFLA